MAQQRGQWSGRLGFILAAAGSAVGLGNLWKFPYVTYNNDGGAFVLVYIGMVLLVGLPIMISEIIIGRRAQLSPVGAFRRMAEGRPGGKAWSAVGFLGVAVGFIILSYYAVIAGWTLRYILLGVTGELGRLSSDPALLEGFFGTYTADGTAQATGLLIFMCLTAGSVFFGVKGGIERVARILMPALFLILFALAIYATTTDGFGTAMSFLFRPNFGELTSRSVLEALGQAFFSMSLGMGAILTYGSYMTRKHSVPRAALEISMLDTLVGILASVIMFSIIFSFDFEVRASAGILFTTLPTIFYQMPGGGVITTFFYVLVAFAALTSTISLMEVISSFSIDELGWNRKRATLTMGAAVAVFGVLNALSMGGNEILTGINFFGKEASQGLIWSLDYLAANWLLPIGGMLIAVFAGWIMSTRDTHDELETGHPGVRRIHRGWLLLIRFAAPLAVGAIIFSVIFLGMEYQ